MEKLRAGVIGLGFIGMQHVDAIMRVPQAQLAAVSSGSAEKARAVSERFGAAKHYDSWREMIADPEINVIHNCTPNALHDEINRAAILAGKHIYSEKPLSGSAALAREMTLLARRQGVAAGLNHQYRLNAAVVEMRARLQKGMAGRPLAMNGCYLQESGSRETDWNGKMENTGIARALSDIGIHWVDTAAFVLGQPVAEVMADLHTHYPVRVDADSARHEMTTEDSAFVLVRFADGTPGQLTVSKAASGHKNDLRLDLWCEGYSMAWEQETPDRLFIGEKDVGFETVYMNPRLCQEETRPFITAPMGHMMGWPDALRNAVQAFYASILDGSYRNETQLYSTFRDGFAGMAFVEACLRSAKERRWAEVERF